jgi:hypothetical protein
MSALCRPNVIASRTYSAASHSLHSKSQDEIDIRKKLETLTDIVAGISNSLSLHLRLADDAHAFYLEFCCKFTSDSDVASPIHVFNRSICVQWSLQSLPELQHHRRSGRVQQPR